VSPPVTPPRVRLILDGDVLMDSTGGWRPADVQRAIQALQTPAERRPGRNIIYAGLLDVLTGVDAEWTATKRMTGPDEYTIEVTTRQD